jgi:mRNA interferase MazF
MPNRGEVWYVDLGLAAKRRPALIVNREYGDNDRALITVIPYTTRLRNSEFEISVHAHFLNPSGAFLVQGITSTAVVHAESFLGTLPPNELSKVEAKLRDWLRLNP